MNLKPYVIFPITIFNPPATINSCDKLNVCTAGPNLIRHNQ